MISLTELIPRSIILDIKSRQQAHHLWKSLVQNTAIQHAESASHAELFQLFAGAFSVGGPHVYFYMSRRAETAGGLCQCQCVEIVEIC